MRRGKHECMAYKARLPAVRKRIVRETTGSSDATAQEKHSRTEASSQQHEEACRQTAGSLPATATTMPDRFASSRAANSTILAISAIGVIATTNSNQQHPQAIGISRTDDARRNPVLSQAARGREKLGPNVAITQRSTSCNPLPLSATWHFDGSFHCPTSKHSHCCHIWA